MTVFFMWLKSLFRNKQEKEIIRLYLIYNDINPYLVITIPDDNPKFKTEDGKFISTKNLFIFFEDSEKLWYLVDRKVPKELCSEGDKIVVECEHQKLFYLASVTKNKCIEISGLENNYLIEFEFIYIGKVVSVCKLNKN